MTTTILLPQTNTRLLRSVMPSNSAWFSVKDEALDAEQRQIIGAAQSALGIAEESTFCMGTKETGDRVIVQPKLVKDANNNVAIRWGKKTYSLPADVTALENVSIQGNNIVAEVKGYVFALAFSDVSKMPESELTKEQKMLRGASDQIKRLALVKKLPLARLGYILHTPGVGFTKLVDMERGEYTVNSYAATSGIYGLQYKLTLSDGRKVDGNTAVKRICEEWDSIGVEVSPLAPATLVVGKTTLTATGKTVVSVELYSHADMQLEPYGFEFTPASADAAGISF